MSIGAIGSSYNNFATSGVKMDPDAYARQYATKNGISFEAAKEELRVKGEPQPQNSIDSTQNVEASSQSDISEIDKAEIASQLRALGIPDNIIQQGPEAVGEYAKEHDITLPEMSSGNKTDNYAGQNQVSDLNRFFLVKSNAA